MDNTRTIIATGAFFGLLALGLALPSILPSAVADEEPVRSVIKIAEATRTPPVDVSKLVNWDFEVEPGISTEPLRESTVRKIAYGRTSFVKVVETTSGVYSTDALSDPHIRYPGIHVRSKASQFAGIALWSGHGWELAAPFSAGSFVTVIPFEGGQLVTTNEGSCVVTETSIRC